MNRLPAALSILLVLCLTVISTGACLKVRNTGEAKGPATLSEVGTAASVTDEGRILNTVTIFLSSTPAIFVSARVNNAPADTRVSARWVYVKDSTGREVNENLFDDTTTVTGSKYINFSHSAPAGTWNTGQYAIQLYINDSEVTDAKFTVKDVLKADVPAPTITYFKAEPEAINYGQAVTLSWKTADAATVDVSPSVGRTVGTGNAIVHPIISTQYTLTATNASGTTTKKINVEVDSFVADKPDLVITDLWLSGDKVNYKIKNIGGVEAKESITGIYISGNAAGQSKVDILAPGQERTYTVPLMSWPYGSNRLYKIPVRACADDYDRIGEHDNVNNCLMFDW